MNQDQIESIVRQLLLTIGGGLVTKGYLDSGTLQLVVGAFMAVGAAGWALYTRRNKGLIASAASVPSVHTIVTDTATALAVPSDKVVSSGA